MNRRYPALLSVAAALIMGICAVPAAYAESTESTVTVTTSTSFLPVATVAQYLSEAPADANEYGGLTFGDKSVYCSATWQKVVLTGDGAQQYPDLAVALASVNDITEKMAHKGLSVTWEGARADQTSYYASDRIYLTRSDQDVLSFMRLDARYPGGPYPQGDMTGYSFDPASGKALTPADVFTDTDAAYELAKSKISDYQSPDQYPDLYKQLKAWFDGKSITDNAGVDAAEDPASGISMAVGYEDVTIYIGKNISSARDVITVTLSFAEQPDMFATSLQNHETGYVQQVLCDEYFTGVVHADIDGDGIRDEIMSFHNVDEYDTITQGSLISSNDSFNYELYGFSIDSHLVCTEEGISYLYNSIHMDNDYIETHVIRLTGGFQDIGTFDGGLDAAYEDDGVTPWAMQNPNRFRISTRSQVLSTLGCERMCKVGEDGMPTYRERYWTISSHHVLTLKQDFTFPTVDEEGHRTGVAALAAGTQLAFERTDRKTTVDFKTTDGTLVRATLDGEQSWPQTISGTNIEDLFDGMIFAG